LADHVAVSLRRKRVGSLLSVCAASLLWTPAAAATFPGTGVELFNAQARRRIPLRVYHAGAQRPLAVLLPGVGAQPGDYSFLANYLARRGFAVAEMQLELRGDPAIATSGNLAALRAPELRLGVNSLGYAIGQLKRLRYASGTRPSILVGHSNGGDVAMLYQTEHPGQVSMIFSLDNLRVPIPRTSDPHICSLRSNDEVPDPEVLPDDKQRVRFNIQVQQSRIHHDRMWNGATVTEKRVMLTALERCLKDRRRVGSGA
jgi:pimeloyl-ACP methyl ester carboxylesterase